MITVEWGNNLEKLADKMFRNISETQAGDASEVFLRKQCIVTPGRIIQHWLQHFFLFDFEAEKQGSKVLANIEYPPLHQFVNDWLYKMSGSDDPRDPSKHPFSITGLTWRIYDILTDDLINRVEFKPLCDYISAAGKHGAAGEQRCFNLAGQLAKLFDDYQVYRPVMMKNWQNGENTNAFESDMLWQPELWRLLTSGDLIKQTYLNAFGKMEANLGKCDIAKSHPAIHVFGVSMMPRVYARFFDLLSEKCSIPVYLYLFNPCAEEWDEILTPRAELLEIERARLEGIPEEALLLDFNNSLLSNTGRGCRDFLGEIIDMTEGQIAEQFSPPSGNSLLKNIQLDIYNNINPEKTVTTSFEDDSLQIHVCHSPMREVEVLRDHLLRWFTENPDLQPRHIQVQVSDMALYAPYIDAVFSTEHKNAHATIPYSIADRVSVGTNIIGEVFSRLLNFSESRFSAPDLIELLQCENVSLAFNLTDADFETVVSLIKSSGIRWGIDKAHRTSELDFEFTECTTWQHGLDRLLLGFVMTKNSATTGSDIPLVCDMVEGHDSETLGKLVKFFDSLREMAQTVSKDMTPDAWADTLTDIINSFFANTDDSYRDINSLRALAEQLRSSCSAGGFDKKIPVSVVQSFIAGELGNTTGGESLKGNSVVFGALRTGATPPRKIICMLGMGDGKFPRSDNRPAYDLFRNKRHRGDPSVRTEDRMAFLEVIMAAEEKLYISYVGRTLKEDEVIPSSTMISELLEYTDALTGTDAIEPLIHKLQPFNKIYFQENHKYFSYDKSNCRAAQGIASNQEQSKALPTKLNPAETALPETEVTIEDLICFFKNPAENFYRTLKAKVRIPDAGQLDENEEFSPYGLSAYKINGDIVTAICDDACQESDDTKRDNVYQSLLQQGVAPLGKSGEQWFADQWDVIAGILEKEIGDAGTLGKLLQNQSKLKESPFEVIIEKVTIAGQITGVTTGNDQPVISVDYRYVSEKATDKLSSWIMHLFTCASGINAKRYSIAKKSNDKKDIKITCFPPLPQYDAKGILAKLLSIYIHGQSAIPVFTPGTSFAFATGLRKKPPKNSDPERADELIYAEACKKAEQAWNSDPGNSKYGDDSIDQFRQAFGSSGPLAMNEDEFISLAKIIFDPMLDAITEGKQNA